MGEILGGRDGGMMGFMWLKMREYWCGGVVSGWARRGEVGVSGAHFFLDSVTRMGIVIRGG